MINGVKFQSYLNDVEKEIRKQNAVLLRSAAEIVLKEARAILKSGAAEAPGEITGNLRRGLKKEINAKSGVAKVGVKAPRGKVDGSKKKKASAAHAWLVEHGGDLIAYADGKNHKEGQKIGTRKPHPFLAPAFERTKERVKAILSEERI